MKDARKLHKVVFAKRWLLDIPLSLLLILMAIPLLVGVAASIRIVDGAPIMFRQTRVGMHGREFTILKFRTMSTGRLLSDGTQSQPEVTQLGRTLRTYGLDELPQLINVLLGDMSLVGPRPMVQGQSVGDHRLDVFCTDYELRHLVRPGITGWAQANGYRGSLSSEDSAKARVAHDLHYVRNTSLILDLYILFWLTPITLIQRVHR